MRIILVDDDSSVLPELLTILKSIPGHEVRVATNSQKAHEHATALGGVDLLITDVVMEPTDGFTLRAEFAAQFPTMRVLFISAYDLSDYAEHLGGAATMVKPINGDELRGFVENASAELAASVRPTARVAAVASGVRQPTAVAQPQAVASSVRQPTVVPQPQAVAQPQAVPVQGIPVSGVRVVPPRPLTSPLVGPAQPSPVAVPQAIASGIQAHGDPLLGKTFGDYQILRILGAGVWGKVYVARQNSVNRLVGLKALDTVRSLDPDARAQFLADARAKAAVSHPFIVSVFEADEREGVVFYTHEFLEGANLAEMISSGTALDEKTALHAMKVSAEGLNYLRSHNLAHGTFDASAIRIGKDGIARLSNLATAGSDGEASIEAEMATLAEIIHQLTPTTSQGLAMLLKRMQGGPNPVTGWPAVLQAVKALEPKIIPVEAAKMKAADEVAMRAVIAAKEAQKRALVVNIVTLVLLVSLIGWMVYKYVLSNERKLDAQIAVPAGTYLLGESAESVTLPGFEIDKFEVSIGRYAKFVDWCLANPEEEHKFDHPRGPRHITHVTVAVETLIKNAKVRDGRVFKDKAKNITGAPVDLNSPMVGITWWDAYAFAKWEGKVVRGGEERDLPLEEEWEAAARGTKGFKFPWGETFEPKKTNSGADYSATTPGADAGTDGFNYWAPVDQLSSDSSPLKVEGMGGNVAEWVYRKEGSQEIPLLKGGSFATGPTAMSDRVTKVPAEDCWYVYPAKDKPIREARGVGNSGEEFFVDDGIKPATRALYIGFRTVKRK